MIDILPGFREFYPEDCFFRNYIFSTIRNCCVDFCFSEYDAPILEPMEMYTEKSGEEIANQLFAFTDRGGRAVSMRPEMTPSVSRMIGSKIHALKRPLKWFSIEENFRYERPQKGRLRSFYQVNFDIFDDDSVYADAEIISLAVHILSTFGLTHEDIHVRFSDRVVWNVVLSACGVSDIPAVLSIIDKMEKDKTVLSQLSKYCSDAKQLISVIHRLRMCRSIDDINQLILPLLFAHAEWRNIFTSRIEQIKKLLSMLSSIGLEQYITIDFCIVRGLAYYTGFIFEIFERSGQSRAIAGGGRYDQLIEKFGYPSTAAVGMAIGDVVLGNILREKHLLPAYHPEQKVYVIFDPSDDSYRDAVKITYLLRSQHIPTQISTNEHMSMNKQFKQSSGAHALVIVQASDIIVRDIQNKAEKNVSFFDVVDAVSSIVR